MHNLLQSYEFIHKKLLELNTNENAYFKPIIPNMTELDTVNITLETPMRANQKDYKKQPYIFMKSRKII